ncbi:MAG: carbohydrate ABC transporter permease [Spirochaetia bacterium]|jgi:raffinose/stachyose/melibiose transport system permease protein|nr:carbohydrate ABC transporter permease [Spirochaetia bacterium]
MAKTNQVRGTREKVIATIEWILVLLLFLLVLFPFVMVAINSLKVKRDIIMNPFSIITARGLTFNNYVEAFVKMHFIRSFFNSLMVTGLATCLSILTSSMLAYYLVRYVNKFTAIVSAILIASMIIPFQALMIPLVSIYGAGLGVLNHRLTLVFMHTGFALAMSTFIYQGFIKSGIPLALEEAALIDGCSKYGIFFRVVFPLLGPTTATLVILNVLAFWNDYLLPSLVLSLKELLTLPLTTYTFYGTYSANYGVIMAALVLTVLPILILYFALQSKIIEGVVSGAVK